MLQAAAKRLFVWLGNRGTDPIANFYPAIDFSVG